VDVVGPAVGGRGGVVVSRVDAHGERIMLTDRGVAPDLPAVAAEVVDTTGAGDALAAGFALGGPPEEAALRGLRAAAECVARMGAMPA
jgi:sugar/nucleoside kinase (ribokinase family)